MPRVMEARELVKVTSQETQQVVWALKREHVETVATLVFVSGQTTSLQSAANSLSGGGETCLIQ